MSVDPKLKARLGVVLIGVALAVLPFVVGAGFTSCWRSG
jgi:branched-chain amino acid transport system permease protein